MAVSTVTTIIGKPILPSADEKKIKAVHAKREEKRKNKNVHKGLQGQDFTRRVGKNLIKI